MPSTRTSLRSALAVLGLLAFSLLSCGREVTGPDQSTAGRHRRFASLALDPQYETAIERPLLQALLTQVPFDKVRITIRRDDGGVALDTLVPFPAGADSLTLALRVPLPPDAPAVGVPMTLGMGYVNTAGDTVFKGGLKLTVAPFSGGAAPPPVQVPLQYTGPGSTAVAVRIAPTSASGFTGGVVRFSAVALDASGNTVAGTPIVFSSSDATVATVEAVSGLATLGQKRGTAQITAQTLTGLRSSATVSVLLPGSMLSATGGGTAPIGGTVPVSATVTASDGVAVAGVSVSFAVASGGGSVTPASAPTDASGRASASWKLGTTPGTQTLTVSAVGTSRTLSATAETLKGVKIVVTNSPSGGKVGETFGVTAQVQDSTGAVAKDYTGSLSVALGNNAAGAALGGTATAAVSNGTASFGGLSVSKAGKGFVLVVSGAGLAAGTSRPFDVTGPTATSLEFVGTPPTRAKVATGFTVSVVAKDSAGAVVTDFTDAVALLVSPAGGFSGQTSQAAVAGVATFGGLTFSKTGSYTISASSGKLTTATYPVTVEGADPKAILIQSGRGQSATIGSTLSAIRVQLVDSLGFGVPGRTVTFAARTGGGTVAPASATTDSAGVASTIWTLGDLVGTQALEVSSTGVPTRTVEATGLVPVVKSLVLTNPPPSTVAAGSALTPAVVVTALDSLGKVVTGFTGTITATIASGPVGATLGGTASVAAVAGVATFSSLQLSMAGTYALRFTAVGIPAVTSGNIVVSPGTATTLAIAAGNDQVGQFVGPLVAAVRDVAGNGVANVPVTFTVTSGGATLSGGSTQVVSTDASGLAKASLAAPIGVVANVTVTADAASLPTITFNARTVSGGHNTISRCELTSSGAAYCWGSNGLGEVGDGTTTQRLVPTAVTTGGLVFTQIADGGSHVCALTAAGVAYCWGDNAYGQLGDGTETRRTQPVAVTGGLTFTRIVVSPYSTCALTAAGALYCWGWSSFSFGGDGVFGVVRTAPTLVNTGGLTFTRISVARYHICAIATTGALYCWGRNSNELGDGTVTTRTAPTPLNDGRVYKEVSVSSFHSCALTTAGAAYCWGQAPVGDGTSTSRLSPVLIASGPFRAISAETNHQCALASGSGLAYCWGGNPYGGIGDGTLANALSPVAVRGGLQFATIKTYMRWNTCARTIAGQPYCWGSGILGNGTTNSSLLPEPVKWVEGTAGAISLVAYNGVAFFYGPAGSALSQSPKVLVRDYAGNAVAGVTVTWTVTGGGGSVAGTTSTTDASGIATAPTWTLGATVGFQYLTASASGLPTFQFMATASNPPANVSISSGDQQIAIPSNSFYGAFAVAVKDAGDAPLQHVAVVFTAVSGGVTLSGGSPQTVYTDASGIARVNGTAPGTPGAATITAAVQGQPTVTFTATTVAVANVSGAQCALTALSAAYCWGHNEYGALGDLSFNSKSQPTLVALGLSFSHIAYGATHSCALTAAGVAYCWGHNEYGALGDGTFTNRSQPTLVLGGIAFASLSVNPTSTCGLTAAGAAYCWGWMSDGIGGDGALGVARTSPTPVNSGGGAFSKLSAGQYHVCGIATTGGIYCWGRNSSGQLGDGSTTRRLVPTPLGDGRTYLDVTVASNFTCAVSSAGTAYCWGYNGQGQLGDGTTSGRSVPTAVGGGVSFSKITAGYQRVCALAAGTGAPYCWGYNRSGALGDGTETDRLSPTPVLGGVSLSTIKAGFETTCGAATSGLTIYCWGSGAWGALGNGSSLNRSQPEPVLWVEGTAGDAASMVPNGTISFTGTAGAVLSTAPQVKVRDYAGTAVSGVTVTWTVTGGGGSVLTATSITNASGIATAPAWTLGSTVGGVNKLTASATGLPSPTFTAVGN